jgi:hypothetical protein
MADTNATTNEGTSEIPEYMLTTYDNPFDPFTQWDQWYAFDMQMGYHTPGLLARISKSSIDLSPIDEYLAVQDAVEEIVRENVSGMHRKVKRGDVLVPSEESGKAAQNSG